MALPPDRSVPSSDKFAKRQAAQGDVFLREVDDALREDQVFGAIRQYGKPVGIVVAAGLLGLAGWLWYDNHSAAKGGEQGEVLTQALDQVEARRLQTGSDGLAPIAKDGNPGIRAAAQMMRAGVYAEENKPDEAAKGFAAIAADTALPQVYRDLATIREVAVKFDKLPPQQVIDRLKPLAEPGKPWFGSAGELVGMAYLKQGRNDLAGTLFGEMAKDKTVPATLRRRAAQLAGPLGVDAAEDPSISVTTTISQTGE